MLEVLRDGKSNKKVAMKALKDLRWRQRFSGRSDRYDLDMANGTVLVFEQQQPTTMGTGTTVWPAAHVLARYLERRRWPAGVGDMGELSVVELGAGTAAVGIVCASLGAKRVVATDYEPQLLEIAQRNAKANGIESLITKPLDWSSASGQEEGEECDVLIASECVLPQLYPLEPLVNTIAKHMTNDNVGLVAYEHRTHPDFDPRLRFEDLLKSKGISLRRIPSDLLDPVYSAEDIEIWELRRTSRSPQRAVENVDQPYLRCLRWTSPAKFQLKLFREEEITFDLVLDRRGDETFVAGIGQILWPSALVAARYFVAETRWKTPQRILELGSGCGLVATVLTRMGHKVTATDLPDVCLRTLGPNLLDEQNARVKSLPWGDGETLESLLHDNIFDVIVCSDCAYDSTSVQPLVDTLVAIFSKIRHREETRRRPDLFIFNEQRTALDSLLRAISLSRGLPELSRLDLPASYWTIDCNPPHRQPPPIAAFSSSPS